MLLAWKVKDGSFASAARQGVDRGSSFAEMLFQGKRHRVFPWFDLIGGVLKDMSFSLQPDTVEDRFLAFPAEQVDVFRLKSI